MQWDTVIYYVRLGKAQCGAVVTQNINQTLNSQKTLHISPSRVKYGVIFVRIWETIDRVITALHCILYEETWY